MWLFRIFTQLEVSMNDVERVEEYTHLLPTEQYEPTTRATATTATATEGTTTALLSADMATATTTTTATEEATAVALLPAAWPLHGAIEFRGVRLHYPSAHTPIFDGLSFVVKPRTRVGVVGRTGAGKSSLTVALFRVVELAAGAVLIDGVDCRSVGLARPRGVVKGAALALPQPAKPRGI